MKKLLNGVAALVIVVTLTACDSEELKSIAGHADEERVWVYSQINIPEEGGSIGSYWYFGKIPKRLYQGIAENSIKKGFILFEDVKYWGDDGNVHEYADADSAGYLVFRVEDIKKIDLLNKAPKIGPQDSAEEEPASSLEEQTDPQTNDAEASNDTDEDTANNDEN